MIWLAWLLPLLACAAETFDPSFARGSNGIVVANDRLLELMFRGERDYSVVLFLTAEGPRYNCDLCKTVGNNVRTIARNYITQNPDDKRLYFVSADVDTSRKHFQDLQLTTVPVLNIYGPSGSPIVKPTSRVDFKVPGDQTQNILKALQGMGFSVKVPREIPWDRIAKSLVTLVGVLVAGFVFRAPLARLLTTKKLYMALVVVAVLLFTTGHMFNVIRKTPLLGKNPDGTISYVQNNYSSQYGTETQIMAVLYAALSFASIMLLSRVPALDAERQVVLSLTLCAVLWVGYSIVLETLKIKHGGYPFSLLPIRVF